MLIVGVAGGTGSGKTTVVDKIIDQLPKGKVTFLPQDSYYKDNSHVPMEDRKEINFDHPDSIEWPLLAQHIENLRSLMDIKVYVDTDADDRLSRVISRDIMERGRSINDVLDRYEKVLKPMHLQFIEPTKRYADIIIPQGGNNKVAIDILVSVIESKINS